MGLVDKIKSDVKKAGGNKRKIVYLRPGTKIRVRFLEDMDEGKEITFHDSFKLGVNTPCQEQYDRNCPYCENEDEEIRTRSMYAWSVWNYDAKEVQIFLFAVNNCSPVPALVAMYETYGTLTDRDYVISKIGKSTDTTYSVVPMDKQKFRNQKAKPLSEDGLMKILDKAFPCDDGSNEDDFDSSYDDDFDDEESSENDYDDLKPKELYKLCKEREIECEPKKNKIYYVNLLEEANKAEDDWDDDDEWEDDED